ncbi:MAG TPA: hypothetical protein VMT00_09215 [Thermoanaerobaculia bacterium]|nr:hypothetical protein [Thermoanaerobaculia bacterium]
MATSTRKSIADREQTRSHRGAGEDFAGKSLETAPIDHVVAGDERKGKPRQGRVAEPDEQRRRIEREIAKKAKK